ncbi:multidrug efflux pump subunit AcrB [Desulfosalsimonas propionicica]|uniref:Multidrug efflux pump subunit AcrB n=1 Tax=Desulfosalsimonas propionicica TaxID=332175 RepID=A0A7W0C7Z7_9BACT|nr:efflux RND transporter permease subunit [Desulfosalsimonas propionicica]MBA2880856.1 multidrug efflux pump subunit AcrB [Desulfosalsimonas propionicica]
MNTETSVPESPKIRPGPIEWMVRNPIAANLLMVILIAGGIWTAFAIQKEVFPEFELDMVEVYVSYPGADPAEVEQGILLPVEEAIRGVEGIEEITSTAREESGRVQIELVSGANRMKVFQDIDQAVNRIRTFPDNIEEPEVRLLDPRRDVMEIGLYGDVDIWTLRVLAERLRDLLLAHQAVTQVELGNVPDYVTHVEIPRDTLREYGLTLGRVAGIIEASSRDIPAGALETAGGEILLRMKERRQWAREFGQIEIVTSQSGSGVMLAEMAQITDGFEEAGFHSRFNRQPSVEIEVFRVGSQDPLEVAGAVSSVLEAFETTLPPGVRTRIDSNRADDYGQRLSLLLKNGLIGLFIVLGILAVFLEYRLAFWVMMGMAISFVGGLVFLPLAGVSINMISMFAFLVALGIVVDDAIVVGENIYEQRQQGTGFLPAAINGAREMAGPVTFSILTNIVAFVPLMFVPGIMGKFWWSLPTVVIIVLAVSLFEAMFILPAHLAHSGTGGQTGPGARLHALQQRFASGFNRFVDRWYRGLLEFCLRYRYITLSAALTLLVVVGGYAYSGHMGMIMMPEVSADEIEAGVTLPVDTTPDQAAQVADQITESTLRMFERHNLQRAAEGVKTNVRGQNFIDVEIVMKPPGERDMTAAEVIELWRKEIGDIKGVDQITFEAERGPGGHRPDVSVDLSHSDINVLEEASIAFSERIAVFQAARDVRDNYEKGKTQFDFTLTPEGRSLGLTPFEVGRQLRHAFYGAEAIRQLRGANEVEVRVKLPESERKALYPLQDLVIRTEEGIEVLFTDIVELKAGTAYTSINRRDGRRVVTVSMTVEPKSAITRVMNEIRGDVLPGLRADYPGITWTFQGGEAEMRESTAALQGGFIMAMAVIYGLLAVIFASYIQPLIVMTAIPFGIVGAVAGHILLGFDLSLISLMGIIALSGVVVNDSLIMIHYANKRRAMHSAFDAIHQAGLRRFRPIALTTLTTFGGLTPIILESSRQAAYLIPMAISLGFGIVFATSIILVIVPCLYLVVEDLAKPCG